MHNTANLGLLGSSESKLKGSGGYVVATLTQEQKKIADIGGPDLFLAPVGRLEPDKISMYYCQRCNNLSKGSPPIEYEKANEEVAENLFLKEKGRYTCGRCRATIAEYKTFEKIGVDLKKDEREREDKIYAAFKSKNYPQQNVSTQYNSQPTNILEVISLLEGLRAKYANEALWSSHSLSQKHKHVESFDDINAVEAYISMCKGVFENDSRHFQSALTSLERGRGSIPTSIYPLTLLCQSLLENDSFQKIKKIESAKKASQTMKEELAREIFDLIVDETEMGSLRTSAGREDRIKYFVQMEHENYEDRYDPVFDQAVLDKAEDRFRDFLEKGMARRERDWHAIMDTLKSRNRYA